VEEEEVMATHSFHARFGHGYVSEKVVLLDPPGTRRGVHLVITLEQLKEMTDHDGTDSVAHEIGLYVLSALNVAEGMEEHDGKRT
jgi:hypothetical protein